MALNLQPYLSDSTSEFLSGILPAIADGMNPNDLIFLAFESAEPNKGDDMERLLGFLQLWMIQPNLILEYYIPTIQDALKTACIDPEEFTEEEIDSLNADLLGFVRLFETPPLPIMNDIGLTLTKHAMDQLPDVEKHYDAWFADQRRSALDQLLGAFSRSIMARDLIIEDYAYLKTGEPIKESRGVIDALRNLLFGAESDDLV